LNTATNWLLVLFVIDDISQTTDERLTGPRGRCLQLVVAPLLSLIATDISDIIVIIIIIIIVNFVVVVVVVARSKLKHWFHSYAEILASTKCLIYPSAFLPHP